MGTESKSDVIGRWIYRMTARDTCKVDRVVGVRRVYDSGGV